MSDLLEDRFLSPKGWRTHSFVNPETGHKIHYGSVFPQREEPPSAVIVCLGGLSEFSEKYFELAHDMLKRGYAFWFMDWQYQGRSGRLAKHEQRRHSDGFDTDISDLFKLVSDYIKPSSVHPDRGRIPMILVAHSMGGNIGLQFLSKYPKFFDAAAFSAPLLGIYNFKWPLKLLSILIRPLLPIVGKTYIFGGSDWKDDSQRTEGQSIFSHDKVRDTLHTYWSKTNSELRIGSVTFGWVIKALQSCKRIMNPDFAKTIQIPVLVAVAGEDKIVDNQPIRTFTRQLPKGTLLEIPGAYHEILVEEDQYRNQFLNAFDKMVKENKIATLENLKPF